MVVDTQVDPTDPCNNAPNLEILSCTPKDGGFALLSVCINNEAAFSFPLRTLRLIVGRGSVDILEASLFALRQGKKIIPGRVKFLYENISSCQH